MMKQATVVLVLLCAAITGSLSACNDPQSGVARDEGFRQLPEIRDIRPERPVSIKLRRNVSGRYSWDLSGSDAERLLQVEKTLRNGLQKLE